jgi:hypothetical protein
MCPCAREIDLARADKRAAVGERYAKAAKLQRPATVSEAVDARRTARGDECSLLPHSGHSLCGRSYPGWSARFPSMGC